ncbi:MAG: hypothetical protein HN742_10445 [Lentisphaerae bacterium]|jgi:outer membrane protein assembly factor BamB|nr:hypothetical protein [Lentisphaerota bacterium]MBT7062317.1 hypothetical protein [Lentisphaerota bacterium]MBT7842283.1 hypothetical protein [Lentisphaerota bacterium]
MREFLDPRLAVSRVLPGKPEQSVFYSVAADSGGKIWLGLSVEMDMPGCWAQLVSYDPETDEFETVADLAKVIGHPEDSLRHPHSKIHTAIQTANDGRVFLTTHMTAPPQGEDHYHFWNVYNDPERSFDGSHLIIHDQERGTTEDLGVIAPRCGCRWLGYNPEMDELYMTSFATCHFIVVKLKTGEVKDLGRISQHDYMGPTYAADGNVYTTDSDGFFIRYRPAEERFERLSARVPVVPWGTTDGTGAYQLLAGPDRRKLYGACWSSFRIFAFDPVTEDVRDYGTLGDEDRPDQYARGIPIARAMTVGVDNRIYATSAHYCGGKGLARLIAIDTESGERTDYGPAITRGFPYAAAVSMGADREGNVYLGTWRRKQSDPLQLIIFNPDGVGKTPSVYESDDTPNPPANYEYHAPAGALNQVFTAHGTFYAQELGMSGRQPVIPRGECAINALACGRHGFVFGATDTRYFVFLPQTKKLIPMGTFDTPCKSMAVDDEGRVYFGTERLLRFDAVANEQSFLRRDFQDRGEFQHYRRPPPDEWLITEDLGDIGGTITAMTFADRLYGITDAGRFFAYEPESGDLKIHDVFEKHIQRRPNIPGALIWHEGRVWFSGHHGFMICHEDGVFTDTEAKIPVGAGREYLNSATALVHGDDGLIYGGTAESGYFFRFDPEAMKITNLGKCSNENRIRALTLGNDGVIWGLAGTDAELTHLVKHDGEEFTDCGIMRAKMPKTWIVHRANALITGADGELLIGEHDDISHLMIYWPPIDNGRS